MQRTATLEQFELLVLAAVANLKDAYGVTIHAKVQEYSRRTLKYGPIYSTLNRLQNKGYITSWAAQGTPERGGHPKRNYKLEPAGEKALKDSALTANLVFGELKTTLEIPYGTAPASGDPTIE